MKLKEFKKQMKKSVFRTEEAHIIAFQDKPPLTNLQLHQWEKSGDIIRLKRGLYTFADQQPKISEIAQALYSPCYFSLEYALNVYGVMPDSVFSYTLVTPKTTRSFKTPFGTFIYQKIKKDAFIGFQQDSLMAEKEKALVDYFYLNSSKIEPNNKFWESSRLNGTAVNFKKALKYAKLFKSKKLITLLESFQNFSLKKYYSL